MDTCGRFPALRCLQYNNAHRSEYDIAVDTEEPQHVISFAPDRKNSSFVAEDDAEHEVASFTLGKGNFDWGPLTMYALMRSGDIYAICPYMPVNW